MQNIPIRGRLKGHRLTFIRRLQCATWAFVDRKQLRRRNMVCERSPRYPEQEYFAHSGGKNDNMPPENPKGTPKPRDDAPRTQAHKLPTRRPSWAAHRQGQMEQTSIPAPKREMKQRGIRRQGSSRTAMLWIHRSSRKRKEALSKRSREANLCRRAPRNAEKRQDFPALIKTTHFSVGLPRFTFLRPGETLIFVDCQEENPPKSGSFLSPRPHRWAASRQKASYPRTTHRSGTQKPEAHRAPRALKCGLKC